MSEQFNFTSDINSLMTLIINTFYTTRDCFLRELISNASDAIDKIRIESLTDSSVLAAEPELRIRLIPNEAEGTLTIWDSGIGMTKADLINKLSCIAHSGTKEFLEMIQQNQADDVNLIGQFGVGFFSAYLVSDVVEVITKNNDDQCLRWRSTTQGGFTVEPFEDPELKRGSKVILHLKKDQLEYLGDAKIRELVTTHSNFVQYPIELHTVKTETREVEEEAEQAEEAEDAVKEEETAEKKTVEETVESWQRLNEQEAIWTRPKDQVTPEEYAEFYRHISGDYQDPLAWRHISIEGAVNFRTVLFVPKAAPFSMFQQNDRKRRNVKLFVRRVFITDDCEDLIPEWLSFIRGVVDADDLPLNISREMLQQDRVMKTIKKQIVKQALELLAEIAEDEEKFKTLYENFSQQIKLGIHETTQEETTRAKLAKLLRFYSTRATETMTSFEDYVAVAKENQKSIYYITGESRAAIENSPFVEGLTQRGYEVLFLTDPIDEYCFNSLREVKVGEETYKLICATKEDLEIELTEEEKTELEAQKTRLAPLVKFMKETLGEGVEKVEVSSRVMGSPCVVSTSQFGWSANMERVIRNQAMADTTMLKYMSSKKIMEINPQHTIIRSLCDRYEANSADPTIPETIKLLFETCLLVSGFTVERPVDYAGRIYRIMGAGLAGDVPAIEPAAQGGDDLSDLDELEEVD